MPPSPPSPSSVRMMPYRCRGRWCRRHRRGCRRGSEWKRHGGTAGSSWTSPWSATTSYVGVLHSSEERQQGPPPVPPGAPLRSVEERMEAPVPLRPQPRHGSLTDSGDFVPACPVPGYPFGCTRESSPRMPAAPPPSPSSRKAAVEPKKTPVLVAEPKRRRGKGERRTGLYAQVLSHFNEKKAARLKSIVPASKRSPSAPPPASPPKPRPGRLGNSPHPLSSPPGAARVPRHVVGAPQVGMACGIRSKAVSPPRPRRPWSPPCEAWRDFEDRSEAISPPRVEDLSVTLRSLDDLSSHGPPSPAPEPPSATP
eukprot:Hpha_TRINITY_DN15438_c2_g2::TRINITY_DN15438_c2_g2_i1::g.172919::m.172919